MIIFKLSCQEGLKSHSNQKPSDWLFLPPTCACSFLTTISPQNFHWVSQKSMPYKFSKRPCNLLEFEWLQLSADLRPPEWGPHPADWEKELSSGKAEDVSETLAIFQWSLQRDSPYERCYFWTSLSPLANQICVSARGSKEMSGIEGTGFSFQPQYSCFRNNLWRGLIGLES